MRRCSEWRSTMAWHVRWPNWPPSAGYADQAHLTRETGAIASRSPAQLRRALERGEGHWSLQPARVRNLQDRFG